jgi:hypothetical protein
MTLIPAALVLGCGGGDDSTPKTEIVSPTVQEPTALSKEQFIKQADGICAEVNAALGTLSNTTSSAIDARQRADLYQGLIEKLRGLGRPKDDSGLDQVLSDGDDIVSAQKQAEQATRNGDDTALASAQSEASSAEAAFSSAADSYGFKECGQGPSTSSSTVTTPSSGVPATPSAPVTTTPAPVAPSAPTGGAPTPAAPTGSATSGGGTTGGGTTGTGTAGGGATGGGATGGTSGSGGVGPG